MKYLKWLIRRLFSFDVPSQPIDWRKMRDLKREMEAAIWRNYAK